LGTSDRVHFHTSTSGGGSAGLMIGDTYNSTTTPMYYITPESNVCLTGTRNNYSLDIRTDWTSRIFIENSGNVGIGTTSPKSGLQVIHDEGLTISGTATTGVRTAVLRLGSPYNTDIHTIENYCAKITSTNNHTMNYGSDLRFFTHPNGQSYNGSSNQLTERMCILGNGNVGIGTTSPDSILHLKSTADVILRLEADTNNSGENDNPMIFMSQDGTIAQNNQYFKIGMNGDAGTAFTGALGNGAYLSSNDYLQFAIAGEAVMTMKYQNKNVGIGTTSPSYKLDVNGTGRFTGALIGNNSSSNTGGTTSMAILAPGENADAILYFGTQEQSNTSNATKAAIIAEGVTSYSRSKLHFCLDNTANNSNTYNASISNSRMTILNTGRVGIGTTSPDAALHVYAIDGNESIGSRYQINASGGSTDSGGNSDLSMIVRGRSWFKDFTFHGSDSRIKKEIEDVPDNLALQQVRNIPCKYYKYVDTYEKGDNRTIGFIAQEVNSVLPIAVSIQTGIIPSVYTNILDVTWEEITETNTETGIEIKKYKMRTSTLTNISGIKYKFYVSNTENDEVEKIITGNDDNTFTFEQQWTNVFCYGREVDDFHVLDKNKLFVLNFSATQELDRQQQADKAKIASLETKVASLESELAAIKAHLGL